jgi:indolepyruvate ferredoxin oxidoreductase
MNKRAFGWGRLAAHDRRRVESAAKPMTPSEPPKPSETLEEIIRRRVNFLTEYQNAAYARRYADLVRSVETAERTRARGRRGLAEAMAKSLFKLMAYKDEYEVARLYTDGEFAKRLSAQFEGGYKLQFHLAPPLWAPRDPATGEMKKRAYGAWVMQAFKVLARLKGLRGTLFDPFGHTAERKAERRLIGEYEAVVQVLTTNLTADNHALALEIAKLPLQIRGFGHVKLRNLAHTKTREAELMAAFRNPTRAAAAE